MRFQFGDQVFKIWFQYSKHDGQRETVCLIDDVKDGIAEAKATFAAGSSVCSSSDQFRKETGRKIALTRALRAAGAVRALCDDKRFRKAAWEAYWARRHGVQTVENRQTQPAS